MIDYFDNRYTKKKALAALVLVTAVAFPNVSRPNTLDKRNQLTSRIETACDITLSSSSDEFDTSTEVEQASSCSLQETIDNFVRQRGAGTDKKAIKEIADILLSSVHKNLDKSANLNASIKYDYDSSNDLELYLLITSSEKDLDKQIEVEDSIYSQIKSSDRLSAAKNYVIINIC